jgi:hypothetical protein
MLQRIEDYRLDPGVRSFPGDFSDIAPGIYFLECCTQQYRDVVKLIILGQ